jgi:hypothetical protein
MSDKSEQKLAEELDLAWAKYQNAPAVSTCGKNVRAVDEITSRLVLRCGNPFCRFPLSALREDHFATADCGDVCATCNDMHSALTVVNKKLRNWLYFRALHEAWKKEEAEKARNEKRRRDRLGLDDDAHGAT